MADTGWVFCGTGAEDSSYGTYPWSASGANITSDNNVFDTSECNMGSQDTYYLKATNFGLSVPNATIDGIEFRIRVYSDDTSGTPGDVGRFVHCETIQGGTIGGTDLNGSTDLNNLSETAHTFGNSTQLWGQTWTYSDVNASNFGVAFAFTLNGTSHVDIKVDSVEVKVYYTVSTTPGTMGNPSGALLGVIL